MKPLVIMLCLAPLLAAAPALNDPWGNSEEALNATIWALGAKNLLTKGPSASLRGADVSPFPGTKGDGVYAHHPPLPVWLMVVPVALGGWEGFSRLLGAACACSALFLLWLVLRRFFDERAALCGLAAAALSVFALRYGRMFTTLTLAAPLFLLGLELTWRRSRWLWPVIAALVLSSWDGVVGAAVLLVLSRDVRAAAVFTLSLAFVGWHLVDATHGVSELLWQFQWRAAGDHVGFVDWLGSQALNVGEGLGPLSLVLLFVAPFFCTREQRRAFFVLAAPGLVMELVFRQGSFKHGFWAYNLMLPAAFAVALLASRRPRIAPWLVAAQAVFGVSVATQRLIDEHAQNQLGALAKTLPQGAELPVLARGSFHPYVSWYAQAKPRNAHTVEELPTTNGPVLVDTVFARTLGVQVPEGERWRLMHQPVAVVAP